MLRPERAESIFQIFGVKPWEALRPIIEVFIADPDRHKQRATAELLSGTWLIPYPVR